MRHRHPRRLAAMAPRTSVNAGGRGRSSKACVRFVSMALALWWGLILAGFASADFNGTWAIDFDASDSLEPIAQRLGASWWRRKLMETPEATYRQWKDRLTIVLGPFLFGQTERLRLDGQPQGRNVLLAGPCTQRTFRSADGKQLISTTSFRTQDGKEARLRVARQLTDGGQTLVVSESLDVTGELPPPIIRRVWRRKSGPD